MKLFITFILIVFSNPVFAASDTFFSLKNTNFIVLLAFILFLLVLIYFRVPSLLAAVLDRRAEAIKKELDEARELREEAQSVLANYERRQKEVQEQANRIISSARLEAEAEADRAREMLKVTVDRRLAAAEEQITSSHAALKKEVQDKAIKIAVSAASRVISEQMTVAKANKLIDESISEIASKLQ